MASREQIETVMELLSEAHPAAFFKRVDETYAGIGAVLRVLYEADAALTAGQISNNINVSTARVAVLLKKMESKGLIIKETGVADARTTVVRLSGLGRETAERMRADICNQVGSVIDSIGMERMTEFAAISKEICSVIGPPAEFTEHE